LCGSIFASIGTTTEGAETERAAPGRNGEGRAMKVFWASDYFEGNGGMGFSVHNKKLREAVVKAGVTFCGDVDDADLVIHVDTPVQFMPFPGRKNLLFTAVEFSVPAIWSEKVNQVDALVVPCTYAKEVCSHYYSGPIEICPEGCDPEVFPYVERTPPGPNEPFRFFYFGNYGYFPRKGIDLMFSSWEKWLHSGRMPANAELYVKTSDFPFPTSHAIENVIITTPAQNARPRPELEFFSLDKSNLRPAIDDPTCGSAFKALRRREAFKRLSIYPVPSPTLPGIVLDVRKLPLHEIVNLYSAAHCFVFPTRGEGWGITLTDALTSGLPSIWTSCTAMLDYADAEIGYPLTSLKIESVGTFMGPSALGRPMMGSVADENEIIARMEEVYANYLAALERGRKASERMTQHWTWANAAEKFIAILEKYAK
jgi:glycosyltransferase involved in cell wall biosynthesis